MTTDSASLLREQFLLDPHVIYLNHGSFGATPRPVFESYQRWQRELERQPIEFFSRRANQLMDQSRASLASYLGTVSSNLAFVTNATTGLNVIARSLKLSQGDEVLATDHEYGALDRTWRYLAQKTGFSYINQPIPVPVTEAEALVDALWAGVTNRTRVIFISHITSPTALIFPLEIICRRAKQAGIITVIDGAHAPGQIPLRLDELGADFYSGNLHKWLCAPKGAAFIYVNPKYHSLIEPLVVSWGWESAYAGSNALVDFIERQGTRDLSAFLAVQDAIRFFEKNNWDAVREDCHQLACQAARQITGMYQIQPLSPIKKEWFSQMVSVPIPGHVDLAEIHRRLYDEYQIEIPVLEWAGHHLVRISIQGYNTSADVETLVTALMRLLPDQKI